ncbi:hypothetical protein LV82_00635 [Albidovulum inexpectatum]|uniref:Aminoglycoside phosphotransferase domain-containing protein n=1 Tax=Albidovulum inexpectatum TaxID=196587 RepID=A0A2S5JMF7_9RHOB|nr:phosphotransferase [Albidovulum inexpectatum]PPB82696.1 hypothetical protein LV82_00635 [Albidovulum inexpectatum]
MTRRAPLIADFLNRAGWSGACRTPLAGDASSRRYERLTLGTRRAILMDAPPELGESTARFARMALWLRGHGYSAPDILAEDHAAGLMLVEDLGDDLLSRVVNADPARETEIYLSACDLLLDLGTRSVPEFVAPLDAGGLGDLVAILADHHVRGLGGDPSAVADIPAIVTRLCATILDETRVVSLRDVNADNLLWLPRRAGLARIGLLDFQDAVAAHPVYDLVSLLQDARRDVGEDTGAALRRHWCRRTGMDESTLDRQIACLGAARALRILGVFARLAMVHGKTRYLDMMPRVWAHLQANLRHPALAPLNRAVLAGLNAPTMDRLDRLRTTCPRPRTP